MVSSLAALNKRMCANNVRQTVVSSSSTPRLPRQDRPLTNTQHLLARRPSLPSRILTRSHQARLNSDRRASSLNPYPHPYPAPYNPPSSPKTNSQSPTGSNRRRRNPRRREARNLDPPRDLLRGEDCRNRPPHWLCHVGSAGRCPQHD